MECKNDVTKNNDMSNKHTKQVVLEIEWLATTNTVEDTFHAD